MYLCPSVPCSCVPPRTDQPITALCHFVPLLCVDTVGVNTTRGQAHDNHPTTVLTHPHPHLPKIDTDPGAPTCRTLGPLHVGPFCMQKSLQPPPPCPVCGIKMLLYEPSVCVARGCYCVYRYELFPRKCQNCVQIVAKRQNMQIFRLHILTVKKNKIGCCYLSYAGAY